MYYKNLINGVAALMLTTITALAECMDPTDPNCICTNCPPMTNYYSSVVYTNGELHLLSTQADGTVFLLLKNGSLLEDYVLERSIDLLTWETITPKFETDTNGMADAAFPATGEQAFFRARVATLVIWNNSGYNSGANACGSYIGYANYYGFDGGYGYRYETNMVRHVAYDGDRTNTIISYLTGGGANGCGVTSVVPLNNSRLTIYFPDNLPTSPYPIHLKGMNDL